MTNLTLRRLQRRLELLELDHLRQFVVYQAARLEATEAALRRAERDANEAERMAEFWQSQVFELADHLPPGDHLGVTQDGALGIVHAMH